MDNFDQKSYQSYKENILNSYVDFLGIKPEWIWIGNRSRRKVTFQIDEENRLGFFLEKSNQISQIETYDIALLEIENLISPLKNFLKKEEKNFYNQVVVTAFDSGIDIVLIAKRNLNLKQNQRCIEFAIQNNINVSYKIKQEITPVYLHRKNQIFYKDFKIELNSDIFIQATKLGFEAIIKIIRNYIEKQFTKHKPSIADVYCGFGAYSFAIYDLIKSSIAFEGDKSMVDCLNYNAEKNSLKNKITGYNRDIFLNPLVANEIKKINLFIINPPRNGALSQISEIAKSKLEAIIYVSCNPETFIRDAKVLINFGFVIKNLTAIDQFYKTKHIELVAIFEKNEK